MCLIPAAVLRAPEMVVSAVGDALQVSFDKLPLTAIVRVTVWERGDEQEVRVYFTFLFLFFLFFLLFFLFLHLILYFFHPLNILPFRLPSSFLSLHLIFCSMHFIVLCHLNKVVTPVHVFSLSLCPSG